MVTPALPMSHWHIRDSGAHMPGRAIVTQRSLDAISPPLMALSLRYELLLVA